MFWSRDDWIWICWESIKLTDWRGDRRITWHFSANREPPIQSITTQYITYFNWQTSAWTISKSRLTKKTFPQHTTLGNSRPTTQQVSMATNHCWPPAVCYVEVSIVHQDIFLRRRKQTGRDWRNQGDVPFHKVVQENWATHFSWW